MNVHQVAIEFVMWTVVLRGCGMGPRAACSAEIGWGGVGGSQVW